MNCDPNWQNIEINLTFGLVRVYHHTVIISQSDGKMNLSAMILRFFISALVLCSASIYALELDMPALKGNLIYPYYNSKKKLGAVIDINKKNVTITCHKKIFRQGHDYKGKPINTITIDYKGITFGAGYTLEITPYQSIGHIYRTYTVDGYYLAAFFETVYYRHFLFALEPGQFNETTVKVKSVIADTVNFFEGIRRSLWWPLKLKPL